MKTIYKIALSVFCTTSCIVTIFGQQAYINREWVSVTGTVGAIHRTTSILDNNQNLIVACNTVNASSNSDVLVTKFDSAACNFIVNNAIGNYETIPEGLQDLLEELATEPATKFMYDLDGNELPEPKTTVDLGIFPVPTSLVILECSNQDGVKPIGFPQEDAPDTDVVIPKQYSPAIIADNCDTNNP